MSLLFCIRVHKSGSVFVGVIGLHVLMIIRLVTYIRREVVSINRWMFYISDGILRRRPVLSVVRNTVYREGSCDGKQQARVRMSIRIDRSVYRVPTI